MNLVTDGILAVALGVEPVEQGVMACRPRPRRAPVLDRAGAAAVLGLGGYIGLTTLVLFQSQLQTDGGPESLARAQTLAFTGIIVLEKVNVLNFRALRAPLSKLGWSSNPWVLLALAVAIGLQIAAVYVPFLQGVLHTVPLAASDWLLLLALSLPLLLAGETLKRLRWSRRLRSGPAA